MKCGLCERDVNNLESRNGLMLCNKCIGMYSEQLEKNHDEKITHPSHYCKGGIECIQAIKAALTEEEFRGYVKGNIIKYVWRERFKNGDEDIKKAKQYADFLED